MHLHDLTAALSIHAPPVFRWAGSVAKRLRQFNIALEGKHSGSASTDALTIADLTLQELIVAALRDSDPIFRTCRIEAEETTGDLTCFAQDSRYTIALDPIDGTKQYRDRTANGYAVILTLRSRETVHYSLVFVPERGPNGSWVQAVGNEIAVGDDDPSRPATDVLRDLPLVDRANWKGTKKIYLIGFQQHDAARAQLVTQAGLEGVAPDDMPGSIYDLLARGEFGGSLIHSPNVYDFPASLQIARILGGDAVWVHNQEPVNFDELWMDDRANMLRLPAIVACSPNREILKTLCDLARDWNRVRYAD